MVQVFRSEWGNFFFGGGEASSFFFFFQGTVQKNTRLSTHRPVNTHSTLEPFISLALSCVVRTVALQSRCSCLSAQPSPSFFIPFPFLVNSPPLTAPFLVFYAQVPLF